MDLHPSCPTGENFLWTYFKRYKSWGREITETEATDQDLYNQLATGNQISQAAKVVLQVVISKDDLRWDLEVACYIVTCLYKYECLFASPSIPSWIGWRITKTIYCS